MTKTVNVPPVVGIKVLILTASVCVQVFILSLALFLCKISPTSCIWKPHPPLLSDLGDRAQLVQLKQGETSGTRIRSSLARAEMLMSKAWEGREKGGGTCT